MDHRAFRSAIATSLCAIAAFGWPLVSAASVVTISVTVSSFDENNVEVSESGEFDVPEGFDGEFNYHLEDIPLNVSSTGRWQITEFSGSFNPDPVVTNSFSVVNLLPETQSFTISVSTVTGSIGAPTTLTGGSAQGGVTDVNGDGATLSTSGAGSAFYTSLVDGTDFVGLYAAPSSVNAAALLSGNLAPLEDFGTPIPSLPAPAVANSIGLRFRFDLSPLDRATGSGVFMVEPVPEPSSIALAVVGFVGLVCWRRTQRNR